MTFDDVTEETFSVGCTPVLPADVPTGTFGILEISVESVTAADAPSSQIARLTLPVHNLAPGPIGPYTVEGRFIEPGGRHSVRVTLDVDGDGRIGVDDLLSVQSHPVMPGFQTMRIPLSRVGG